MKMKENVLYAAQGFVVGKDWTGDSGFRAEGATRQNFS